jgi:hypothetical protein
MEDLGPLSEMGMIGLALQVVDGLKAAQEAGLIHRDIKPANILIDENETAKIVDFGLSLATEGGAVRADEIWATPYYVSPESLEHAEEDHRADMYSLGATLYHALSGVPPVEEKEMSTRILKEAKQSIAPLKGVAPWLSQEMIQLVERAMSYRAEDRFGSYEELRHYLDQARRALEAKGQRAPVHGAIREQRRERMHAHRRAWTLAGLSALALLLVASAILIVSLRGGDAEEETSAGPRPVIVPGADPGLDQEIVRSINAAYERARQALGEGDFLVAEEHFVQVWEEEKAPVPTAAWAGFEAAVSGFLDGRSSDARNHLARLFDFVNERGARETALGRRLQSAAEILTDLRFVPEERVPRVLQDPFRATVFFSFALKIWEQGDLERAHAMFEQLAAAGPWPEAEWMIGYREHARRYLIDYRQLSRADHSVEGKGLEELEASLRALDEVYGSLETRGRARFNVKVWQSEILRRVRVLKGSAVAPEWKELKQQVFANFFRQNRFAEGAEALEGAEVGGELERNQRLTLVAFSVAAGQFLAELDESLRSGAREVDLRTRASEQYTHIVGSQKEGLMVEKEGAARSLAWQEIEPHSLLMLHRRLTDESLAPAEKAERLRRAVGFAWLSGLQPEAIGLVEEIRGLAPGLGAQLDEMLSPFGAN